MKAAWAPGGLHEGPGWPRGGSRGAAWRVQNVDFSLVFTFSMHLALWLILLALGSAHVASEIAIVEFSLVFNAKPLQKTDAA